MRVLIALAIVLSLLVSVAMAAPIPGKNISQGSPPFSESWHGMEQRDLARAASYLEVDPA